MDRSAHKAHNESELKTALDHESRENGVSAKILDSAFKIHRTYGPLLESAGGKNAIYSLCARGALCSVFVVRFVTVVFKNYTRKPT